MQIWVATTFALFTLIASIDAFYFHFFLFRLHIRPECKREHLLHTLNACLLPFGAGPLLLGEAGGAVLWAAILANLLTFGVETLDVLGERKSRENLGGLPSVEYWMHFTMSGLRWAWIALAAGSIPESNWYGDSFWRLPIEWRTFDWLTGFILVGSVFVALFHLYFIKPEARIS